MASNISIRNICLEDTDKIVAWRNDETVRCNLFSQSLISKDQHIEYYHNNILTGKIKQFIIIETVDGKSTGIGSCFIKNIDNHSKKAEFGIFIGENSARGKGYGKEATRLTIEYAFNIMQLHRLYLSVFSDNLVAITAYKKCGFQVEGVLRQDCLRGNTYSDVTIMGILNNHKDEV